MATQEGEPAAAVRMPVQGRPGIWCRKTPNGRVRFEISYEDGGGQTRWLTVAGGLGGAEAALAALERRLVERAKAPDLTFATVADRWLEHAELSARVRQAYEWALQVHLLPRLGSVPVGEIAEWHAMGLLEEFRQAGYAEWTLHALFGPLGAVMRYAAAQGVISANPFADVLFPEGDPSGTPVLTTEAGCTVVSLRHFRATLSRR
jgi:hypothetical protein